jgi:AraC-like DNA-binding protein
MPNRSFVTVPISYVHRLLDSADLDERVCESMVAKSGIAPMLLQESAARVTPDQFSTLYRLLARELDDELPGMFSRPVPGGTLKLLCLSVLDSANLKIALYRMTRFFRIVFDDLRIELAQRDGLVCMAVIPTGSTPPLSTFAQEMLLKVIHGVTSWLAGRNVPLARVDLAYARPEHAAAYAYLYPGPAHFDQAATAFHFEVALLESPIRQNKRTLGEFLSRAPADWLFVSSAERIISHRVREYLEKRLHSPTPIAEVADALHFSVRTLSRRLDEEGTTFLAIKDELRRDVAIQRLTKTDLPIAVIGAEIGFDDPTTFHRAFRKWTGSTPGAYRPKR